MQFIPPNCPVWHGGCSVACGSLSMWTLLPLGSLCGQVGLRKGAGWTCQDHFCSPPRQEDSLQSRPQAKCKMEKVRALEIQGEKKQRLQTAEPLDFRCPRISCPGNRGSLYLLPDGLCGVVRGPGSNCAEGWVPGSDDVSRAPACPHLPSKPSTHPPGVTQAVLSF